MLKQKVCRKNPSCSDTAQIFLNDTWQKKRNHHKSCPHGGLLSRDSESWGRIQRFVSSELSGGFTSSSFYLKYLPNLNHKKSKGLRRQFLEPQVNLEWFAACMCHLVSWTIFILRKNKKAIFHSSKNIQLNNRLKLEWYRPICYRKESMPFCYNLVWQVTQFSWPTQCDFMHFYLDQSFLTEANI